jgi:hypothetical protein
VVEAEPVHIDGGGRAVDLEPDGMSGVDAVRLRIAEDRRIADADDVPHALGRARQKILRRGEVLADRDRCLVFDRGVAVVVGDGQAEREHVGHGRCGERA